MKKLLLLIALLLSGYMNYAQDEDLEREDETEDTDVNSATYTMGDGFKFSFNEGNYIFNLGGFIQPSYTYSQLEDADSQNEFNSRRSYLILSGMALKEKVSFMVQTDYSLNEPLLDAWVAYHPTAHTVITMGQKQTFVNNREMTYREDRLQFADRSLLSTDLSDTGREFGLFAQTRFTLFDQLGIAPMAAVTSGDGRNSFGENSRDADLGGLKIGARLDIYPLGYFKEGNDLYSADLLREDSFKMVLGGAISKNSGASSAVGEGHGDFLLYAADGDINLPDYTQAYIDILMKFKGFSLLAEFTDASVGDIGIAYVDENSTAILAPGEISQRLALGESYNVQLGYVLKSGWSLDLRTQATTPEFDLNPDSVLRDYSSYTVGVTKYFKSNNLKMQAAFTSVDYTNLGTQTIGEFLVQIAF
jgi:hypothetical protein